jgi:hypothetical protein
MQRHTSEVRAEDLHCSWLVLTEERGLVPSTVQAEFNPPHPCEEASDGELPLGRNVFPPIGR